MSIESENNNIIKPEWFKREKLNLWLRIKLFFKPTKISWDVSSTESTTVWLKVCDGKIFILKVEQINNLTNK